MDAALQSLRDEIELEVHRILNWWRTYAPDYQWGGFAGEIDQNNQIIPGAEKGSVLHSRILWTFSAAYSVYQNEADRALADRAYDYLVTRFVDPVYHGVYWGLNPDGAIKNDRKQIYAQAFTIYGLSEYYKISKQPSALQHAIAIFYSIERYSRDPEQGGYFEAYSREWKLLDDLRLSEKDRNDPKTMNTHLHVIEAYANLYEVWKDPQLLEAITGLLHVFEKHIINRSGHLDLFFNRNWQPASCQISYGHDIEAAWLLPYCIEQAGLKKFTSSWEVRSLEIANAAAEGLQQDGSFIHEFDPATGHRDTHREWWVSAEGMVGFLYAYQVSKNPDYVDKVIGLWRFAKTHLINQELGEWKWGVNDDYTDLENYKMGFWKCPYHNVRACLEILRRLKEVRI